MRRSAAHGLVRRPARDRPALCDSVWTRAPAFPPYGSRNALPHSSLPDDFVVVQGIIDVYFEEEDKIILVDYKTDRVREGGEDILIRRYRAQMESYQQALEKITGKCVKEIYIYSVTLQKTIPVHV